VVTGRPALRTPRHSPARRAGSASSTQLKTTAMKFLPILATLAAAGLALSFLSRTEAASSPSPAALLAAPAKTFQVDPAHSAILFKVKHQGVAWNYGRFIEFSGEIVLDETDPAKSSVKLEVQAASVDTGNSKRDQHVASPDFFDVKQFPTLGFESTRVGKKGGAWNVEGNLDFHGTKKKITVEFEKTGEGPGRGGATVAGFYAEFTIKRSEFGSDFMIGPLSDEVTIIVSLEAGAKE